jgi:hypothetical protein
LIDNSCSGDDASAHETINRLLQLHLIEGCP